MEKVSIEVFRIATSQIMKGLITESNTRLVKNYYRYSENVWIDSVNNPNIVKRLNFVKSLVSQFAESKGKDIKILDVGAWSGLFSNELKLLGYNNITCLELNLKACHLGEFKFNLPYINEDVEEYKTDEKYDVIIMGEIIEHLVFPKKTINKVKSWLKEEGILIVTLPREEHMWPGVEGDASELGSEHINQISIEELIDLGLVVTDTIIADNNTMSWHAGYFGNMLFNTSKVDNSSNTTFHLLGLADYKLGWEEAPNNPFNTKIIYMCRMLKSLGYKVIVYGVEGSNIDEGIDEFVPVVSKHTYNKLYSNRDKNGLDHLSNQTGIDFDEFMKNTPGAIEIRVKENDFILNFFGDAFKPITDQFEKHCICVEPGIGHGGSYLQNRIFESYTWATACYYRRNNNSPSYFPNNYDYVIPAYFDEKDYPFESEKDDYYVFLGRKIVGKGLAVAIDLTHQLGKKLVVIGGGSIFDKEVQDGSVYKVFDHVVEVGVLPLKQKVKFLSKARALIYFSLYVEPFGHAPIEAMFCGTPVITSDYGAFVETNQHGVSGYRCKTMNDLYWACKKADELDPFEIRKYAVDNYGLEHIKEMFKRYFKEAHDLKTGKSNWYSIDINNPANLDYLRKKI